MTGRERILNHLAGRPVDRLPVMPITMMFACAQVGARYRDYCTDYRVMVEGQTRTAEKFGFDYVNTLPADISVNHINLNEQTVEGLRHKTKPIFCVQYHPEASPGPHDSTPLFAEFRELIRSR